MRLNFLPLSCSLLALPLALLLGSSAALAQSSDDSSDVAHIFDTLREHTSYGLSSVELRKALNFKPRPELANLRKPFESEFTVTYTRAKNSNAIGGTFTYYTATRNWSAEPGTNPMQPHTFAFGPKQRLMTLKDGKIDFDLFKPFTDSSYFLSSTDPNLTKSFLLAPLRMDEKLIVMAASMGSQFDMNNWFQNHKGETGPKRTPRSLMLLIGVRTDELDQKINDIKGQDNFRYHLRMGSMTLEELEKARVEQLSQMPTFEELVRHNSQYRTLNINHERANYNLATRDMRGEVTDLVLRAAAGLPQFQDTAATMLKTGGFGVLQSKGGKQYVVQSLAIPVDDIPFPTQIDKDIVEFVKKLIDPKLELQKKILLPPDLNRGLALLEKMKRNKAAKEMKAELKKAKAKLKAESKREVVAENETEALLSRLTGGSFSCRKSVGP